MNLLANKYFKIVTLVFTLIIYLIFSLNDLRYDVINPDGINWHNRTLSFTQALQSGAIEHTFQVYHPGVTLMWISGPVLSAFTQSVFYVTDAKDTFLTKEFNAKLSLVLFCFLLFAISVFVLYKLVGYKFTFIYSLLFALQPFLIGMRRLYHLDFLMTMPLFLCFLLLVYFNYKKQKLYLVIASALCFALALLTKTSAIMFLPVVPALILFGNLSLVKKGVALGIFIFFSCSFIYALFPALWVNSIHSIPYYYTKLMVGINDVGMIGKKEVGNSGEGTNVMLTKTIKDKDDDFYFATFFLRLSMFETILFLVAIAVCFEQFGKYLFTKVKSRDKLVSFFSKSIESAIVFWSFIFSIGVVIALTIAVKKSDRYLVLIFPFMITLVSWALCRLNKQVLAAVVGLYLLANLLELSQVHPYYLAYTNPLYGGITTRLLYYDDAPFGIGSYAAYKKVAEYRALHNETGLFTISGTKSTKAVSVGALFSLYPSCVTDYYVVFALDKQPKDFCPQSIKLIDTVKVAGINYWNIYRRDSQKHQSYDE